MLASYIEYLKHTDNPDNVTWPDYHRGFHRGRISLAREVVNELEFTLNENNQSMQVRQDL